MLPQNREKPTPVLQSARKNSREASTRVHAWYHDAILSLACATICLTLGKGVSRAVGPFGGLFFLLITGGAAYIYGRAAWRGLMGDRGQV